MKKFIAILMVCMLSFGLIACGTEDTTGDVTEEVVEEVTEEPAEEPAAEEPAEEAVEEEPAAEVSGTIVITGSTSVEKILNDMADEFTALNPGVSIEYTGSGSSAGIKDTKAGTNNIGASSRELKEEEVEDTLKQQIFAYDGIAVIVNPANGVEDITIEQLLGVYSGEITNWSELGGNDAEIFVVSREESSGTRSAFEELIGLEDVGLTSKAAVSEGNGPVQAAVAGNENGIGYVSFSFIDDTVKALTVDGVEATAELAKSGEYKLSRPFMFVYYEDKATDAGLAFLEYTISEEGQEIVSDHDGISVN